MATQPRQILPGRTLFVTGQALLREFRFCPEPEVVQTIRYCLGATMMKYRLDLHAYVWMSNHYHLVLTDVEGRLPDFMRDLNSLTSRALNAFRDRLGQNYAREGYNMVVPADEDAVLRHCAYTEANPCAANLVRYAWEWNSVTSAGVQYGQEIEVERPQSGLWATLSEEPLDDEDPEEIVKASFVLTRPPCMGSHSDELVREAVYQRVKAIQDEAHTRRARQGVALLGMKLAQSMPYRSSPNSSEAPFKTKPQISGTDHHARKKLKESQREFLEAYRLALKVYRQRGNAEFPLGTWWMKRCLQIGCPDDPP